MKFAAGTVAGPRGAIWTLWTGPRGDLYLGGAGITPDLKASLHASGDWRHAFAKEHYRSPAPFAPPKRQRVIQKWRRPPEFTAGYTRAFQILVPDEHIVTVANKGIDDPQVRWAPRPGPGNEIYFTAILGPQSATGWPGKSTMGTQLLHQEDLGNGERLWLVWHGEPRTPKRNRALAEVMAMVRTNLEVEPRDELRNPVHRVFTMGAEDGTGVYADLSLPVIFGEASVRIPRD